MTAYTLQGRARAGPLRRRASRARRTASGGSTSRTATPPACSIRKQFSNDQITRSRKLEGAWWGDGGAYFVCSFARTADGSAAQHDGQIWFLDPRDDTIDSKLHFAYTPDDQDNDPDGPDNITVSAYGGVIIAEDGDGVNHLVGSTDHGDAFFFARNDDPRTPSSPARLLAPTARSCSPTCRCPATCTRSPARSRNSTADRAPESGYGARCSPQSLRSAPADQLVRDALDGAARDGEADARCLRAAELRIQAGEGGDSDDAA